MTERLFTTTEVVSLTGFTMRQVDWMLRNGVKLGTGPQGQGYRRMFTRTEVEAFGVLRDVSSVFGFFGVIGLPAVGAASIARQYMANPVYAVEPDMRYGKGQLTLTRDDNGELLLALTKNQGDWPTLPRVFWLSVPITPIDFGNDATCDVARSHG